MIITKKNRYAIIGGLRSGGPKSGGLKSGGLMSGGLKSTHPRQNCVLRNTRHHKDALR